MKGMTNTDFKKLIGERVKFYRKLNNLTQEELAEAMDFNTKSISLLENGHNYILEAFCGNNFRSAEL